MKGQFFKEFIIWFIVRITMSVNLHLSCNSFFIASLTAKIQSPINLVQNISWKFRIFLRSKNWFLKMYLKKNKTGNIWKQGGLKWQSSKK